MEFAEIKEIITEKIKTLNGVMTGQEFNETYSKIRFSLPYYAFFVPLENVNELMADYENYAQMTDFLGATTLTLPNKKKAYFEIYIIEGGVVTKEIYCIDRFFTGAKIFAVSHLRTIDWNTSSGYIGEKRMKEKQIPMRVNQPWDHVAGSKHVIMKPETLREEPIIATLLDMKCYGVMDYIAELERALEHNANKTRELHVSLSWTELIKTKSIKEIKETKWKKIQALSVNKGKLNVFQLNAIKNMRPYITWEQTERFIQALHDGANYSTDPFECITYLLQHIAGAEQRNRVGYINPEQHFRVSYIKDMCVMLKNTKKRLDLPVVTGDTIVRTHNTATREHNALLRRRKYTGKANILDIHNNYKPLVNALSKDSRFELITRATGLLAEGDEMGHCVGSYIDDVNAGHCIISKAQIGDERATIEFCQKDGEFYARQIQLKYNKRPSEETRQEVYALLDKANTTKVNYRKFDWDYHA